MNDPYKSPVSEVDSEQGMSDFTRMPRMHTLIVVVFVIVSMGLYIPYWAITRAVRFNLIYPVGKVSMQFTYIVCAIYLASFGMDLFDLVGEFTASSTNLKAEYETLYIALSLSGSLGFLIWVFYFRYKLNNYLVQEVNSFSTVGGVLTFFFGIIYLNFKINQTIDDLNQASKLVNMNQTDTL